MLHAVILAGGSGTRLWPESRAARPKQLLAVRGSRTLIQTAVDRLGDLVPLDCILVSTTRELAGPLHESLSILPRDAFLCEPYPRNTAPCIGLAAIRLLRHDPEAVMVVMPADHIIEPPERFRAALRAAHALVNEDPSRLITFGIPPTYPSPSFGYLHRGEAVQSPALAAAENPPRVFTVAGFREKPALETARDYVASGEFLWNAGIFVWRADTILYALQRYRPAVYEQLQGIAEAVDSPKFAEILDRRFQAVEKISIDYAVMERADNVVLIEADFLWDDVGGWRAMERLYPQDSAGNTIAAEKAILIEATGNIIRCRDPHHLVAVLGGHDLVIVATPDATLVADKRREEDIRAILAKLEELGWKEFC